MGNISPYLIVKWSIDNYVISNFFSKIRDSKSRKWWGRKTKNNQNIILFLEAVEKRRFSLFVQQSIN